MNSPLVTFVTRCCKRPEMLAQNIGSVRAQSSEDWEQIFIVDDEGRGVVWANQQFYRHKDRVHGEYAFILDDDKVLEDDDLVRELKEIALANDRPEVIMTKARACRRGILPKNRYWGYRDRLECPCINETNYVVRSDVWKRHIRSFGWPKTLQGAWQFPAELIKREQYRFAWLDIIAAKALRLSQGKIDTSLGPDWFDKFMEERGSL